MVSDTSAFSALSSGVSAVSWAPDRIDLFWIDERAVPPEHAESNFGLAWRAGFGALPLEPTRVHRLTGEAPDLDVAAQLAEGELRTVLGSPPRLDLALLGVGADGHVASLFPGHLALAETERWVVAVEDSPKPPPRRLTVTLPLLATVDLLVVGVFGAEKAGVVREAIEDPGSALPLAHAARLASRRLWLLDSGAASRLSRF
jgi:6-phosphogluconolactonase